VIAAGEVTINVGDTVGLNAWLGTEPLELEPITRHRLTQGRHRLTLVIDRSLRTTPLGLTIDESSTNARFVSGK
jgi:hypothetical protein